MFHKDIKPLKGLSGVQEIRVNFDKDTYRSVYVLNLGDKIYMLHVFKKKSKKRDCHPKVRYGRNTRPVKTRQGGSGP